MERLNKQRETQTELLRLIDEKMNDEYAELMSSNSNKIKVVHFSLYLSIEQGEVMGSAYYEQIGNLLKKGVLKKGD